MQIAAGRPVPAIPVSVNLIVKNCAASLDACLASLRGFLLDRRDEIVIVDTGSTDGGATVAVGRRYGARIIERPGFSRDVRPLLRSWLPEYVALFESEGQGAAGILMDFGAARQVALEASRHECIFWLDSDDTLWEQRPGMLRTVVEQGFRQQYEVLLLDYEYLYDPVDGRCLTMLRRERVVDRTRYAWQGRCHELLVARDPQEAGRAVYYGDLPVRIKHSAHRQDHRRADIRNYVILRSEVDDAVAAGREPATRTRFYLGNACRGLGLKEEALGHYAATVEHGGTSPNRYAALLYIAELHLGLDPRPEEAAEAAQACMTLDPEDPRGHFLLSRARALQGRWSEALASFESGRRLHVPATAFAIDPEQIGFFPWVVAVAAALELGRIGYARALALEMRQRRPDHPDTRAAWAAVAAAEARAGGR